jgi:hypothetical protein
MHIETSFVVSRSREEVVEILFNDESLVALLPGRSEIIDRVGQRKTTSTQFTGLGQNGTAIFHFDFLPDGRIRFAKECDGVVWEELSGEMRVDEGGETRVWISLRGRTKPKVPEFAIKSPMEDQLLQMSEALAALL